MSLYPLIIGTINQGTSFYIGNVANLGNQNLPYVLTTQKIGTSLGYIFELFDPSNISSIPVFQAQSSGTGNSFTILDTTNQGGFAINSNSEIIFSRSPQPLLVTSDYTSLESPSQFFSSVPYSFKNPQNNQFVKIEFDSLGVTGYSFFQNAIFIPTTWYYNCDGNSCSYPSNPQQSLGFWACMANNSVDYCQYQSYPSNGFIDINQANNNYNYNYCDAGNYCGKNNCFGNCEKSYDSCQVKNQTLSCQFDFKKYFEDYPWWKSIWFIVTISVIGFLILVFLFLIIFFVKKEKDKQERGETTISSKLANSGP